MGFAEHFGQSLLVFHLFFTQTLYFQCLLSEIIITQYFTCCQRKMDPLIDKVIVNIAEGIAQKIGLDLPVGMVNSLFDFSNGDVKIKETLA